ncbi:MAG TPA: DUF296 domain-containing protein [Dissulfurispiraceae bacterium]|nr:DUF296 domain-containing protein [Dissulfurispiraceae bacterium]
MKYTTGEVGRVIVARFEDGDDVLKGIIQLAKDEKIKAGVFHCVGGLKGGRFVVGPKTDQMPPEPEWRQLTESHETFGFGTIFWRGDEPRVHFHGAYGKFDSVKVGCLRESSETFMVLEVVIIELKGISASREFDPVSKMVLLKL